MISSVSSGLTRVFLDANIIAEPAVLFRGPRCVRCEEVIADPDTIVVGFCPEC